MDATAPRGTGSYTDDGWDATTHVTVPGARAPERTAVDVDRPERGVAGWLAVVILIGVSAIGGAIDLLTGSAIKGGFNIALIVGSIIAIVIVRRRSMFSVVVAPPLVYFVASALILYIRSGGLSNRSQLIDSAVNWLVYGFPAIAGATAAVLIIAGIRMVTRR